MTTTIFAIASLVGTTCCVCSFANTLTTRASENREKLISKVSQHASGKTMTDGFRIAKQLAPGHRIMSRPIESRPLDLGNDPSSPTITLVYSGDKIIAAE